MKMKKLKLIVLCAALFSLGIRNVSAQSCPIVTQGSQSEFSIISNGNNFNIHLNFNSTDEGLTRTSSFEIENLNHQITQSSGQLHRGEYLIQSSLLSGSTVTSCDLLTGECDNQGGSEQIESIEISRYWNVDDRDYATVRYRNDAKGQFYTLLIEVNRNGVGEIITSDVHCFEHASESDYTEWLSQLQHGIDLESLKGICSQSDEVIGCEEGVECAAASIVTTSCPLINEGVLNDSVPVTKTPRMLMKQLKQIVKHARLYESEKGKLRVLRKVKIILLKLKRTSTKSHGINQWKIKNLSKALRIVEKRKVVGISEVGVDRIYDRLLTLLP